MWYTAVNVHLVLQDLLAPRSTPRQPTPTLFIMNTCQSIGEAAVTSFDDWRSNVSRLVGEGPGGILGSHALCVCVCVSDRQQ